MKWLMLPATVALAGAATGIAEAKPTTPAHARAYEHVYRQVARHLGRRAPGRNIVKYGTGARRHPSDQQTVSSLAVLQRMLSPAPSGAPVAGPASAEAASASGGGGNLPACASESGTNYSTGADNTNSSSGATGRYQILPSTAAAYGCNLGSAAGQDACAETIYQHQGASAWVGCGG